MEALILSCGTGGGHRTAAQAVAEELTRRGHTVTALDPYDLVSNDLAAKIGNMYIRLVQKAPSLFGAVYRLGDAYQNLPFHSPVYWMNGKMGKYMQKYLTEHSFDIIISTHIFPGEIFAHMKKDGYSVPRVILIATDYTSIPFTEETNSDFYIIPSGELQAEFRKKGTPAEKLLPYGIPVRKSFSAAMTQARARRLLQLAPDRRYLLLSGGSIGAGHIRTAMRILEHYLQEKKDTELIVICGSNHKLYKKLSRRYGKNPRIHLLQSTSKMAVYMKACNVFLTKPGGLSSTEAAVAGIPMIHIPPIPGCETRNVDFFARHGMALPIRSLKFQLLPMLRLMEDENQVQEMKENQAKYINQRASEDICDFVEGLWRDSL